MSYRLLLFILTILSVSPTVRGQELRDTVSVSFRDLPLEIVLDSITHKSGYYFSYNADIIPPGSLFSLNRNNVHVRDLLAVLLVGTNLEFTYLDNQIILKSVKTESDIKGSKFPTISGWVRDVKTKEPIVGAHVFINGSTIGTTTDAYGNYRFFEVPPGNYIIVFSHIGYDVASYQMNAKAPVHHKVNAVLTQSINLLKELEIKSLPLVDEAEWMEYYRKFCDQFIGNAANAPRCTFENPEVLEFAHSDSLNTYEAIALEPLIMRNEGLGYKVIFNLSAYTSSSREIRFHVTARFESLDPPSRRLGKRWKKNREKSYLGSRFHFFKALMNNRLEEEGFSVYQIDQLEDIDKLGNRVQPEDVLVDSEKTYKYLKFEGYLVVIYKKELQSSNYQSDMADPSDTFRSFPGPISRLGFVESTYQKSVLKLDSSEIKILPNGQILDPEDLSAYGYWSWERMSELMPIDYDPKSDIF